MSFMLTPLSQDPAYRRFWRAGLVLTDAISTTYPLALQSEVPPGRPETPRPRASPSPARRAPFWGDRPGVRASRHRVPAQRVGAGARRPRGGPGGPAIRHSNYGPY